MTNLQPVTSSTIPGKRGCGYRVEDGIYLEVGIGPGGRPVEEFVVDPMRPTIELFGDTPLPAVGVTLLDIDSVTYVIDRVGLESYPYPQDFINEAGRLGVSRRLSEKLDFSRLTPASRLLIVHDRAILQNLHKLPASLLDAWACFTGRRDHARPRRDCPGCWAYLPGDALTEFFDGADIGIRSGPSWDYAASPMPPGFRPAWTQAVIASFPISDIIVVKGERTDELLQKVSRSSLPVGASER